jgi:signal transduction histidine kinase
VISWTAFKLLAAGGLEAVLKGLLAALKWVLSDVRNALLSAFVPAFLWAAIIVIPDLREDLAETEQLLTDTQLAHLGTITNYIDAGNEAQRQAEANVARVEAEQEAITDEVTRDLRSDLAAVSVRFDRLRARSAAAVDPGRANPAGLPEARDAAGRAAVAPGNPDVSAARELTAQPLCPSQFVCLTIDQAQRASEDARRHDALIDWALGQSAVRFTPEGNR